MTAGPRFSLLLLLVLTGAAVLRGLYLWTCGQTLPFLDQPVFDAAFHDAWARHILGTGPGSTPFYHAPGYPFFLAAVYGLFGARPVAGAIVQSVLGVAGTALAMLAAERLFGRREALLAGALMALAGPLYFFESKLVPGSLALFLGLAAVLAAMYADQGLKLPLNREERQACDRLRHDGRRLPRPPVRHLAVVGLAGSLAGAVMVCQPELFLFPLGVGFSLFNQARRGHRPAASPLLFLIGVLAALAPTWVFNLTHGAPLPVATSQGLAFHLGNNRGASGWKGTPPGISGSLGAEEIEADSLIALDLGRTLPPAPESGYWTARGLAEIAADPPRWLGLGLRKAWLFAGRRLETPSGSFRMELERIPYLRAASVTFNVLVVAGLAGIILAAGRFGAPRGARLPLAAPGAVILAGLGASLLFFVDPAFKLFTLPALALFSAHALARSDAAWREGRKGPVMVLTAVSALLILATWWPPGRFEETSLGARLLVEAGRGLEARELRDRAGRAYREALAIDAGHVGALMRLSQIALQDRNLSDAIDFLERARASGPRDFAVRNNLGTLYYQAQRYDDCEREMEAASAIDPGDPGPYYYRGLVARKREDHQTAETLFLKVLSRNPGYAPAYMRLIDLHLDLGDVASARAWADSAGARGVALPEEVARRLR